MGPQLCYIPKSNDLPTIAGKSKRNLSLHPSMMDTEDNLNRNELFSEQIKEILKLIDSCKLGSVLVDACKDAINNEFISMKDNFFRTIKTINVDDRDYDAKRLGLLLALRRMKYFLEVIQHVLTYTDSMTASLLSNAVDSVQQQLKEETSASENNEKLPAFAISSWTVPSIVFDIPVAKSSTLQFPTIQPPPTFKINSGLAAAAQIPKGKNVLPFNIEVRTITSFFTESIGAAEDTNEFRLVNLKKDSMHKTYNIKILRCFHLSNEKDPEGLKKSSGAGEIMLLVSLRPSEKNTNTFIPDVKSARA